VSDEAKAVRVSRIPEGKDWSDWQELAASGRSWYVRAIRYKAGGPVQVVFRGSRGYEYTSEDAEMMDEIIRGLCVAIADDGASVTGAVRRPLMDPSKIKGGCVYARMLEVGEFGNLEFSHPGAIA
jgi:hypothetical protein